MAHTDNTALVRAMQKVADAHHRIHAHAHAAAGHEPPIGPVVVGHPTGPAQPKVVPDART